MTSPTTSTSTRRSRPPTPPPSSDPRFRCRRSAGDRAARLTRVCLFVLAGIQPRVTAVLPRAVIADPGVYAPQQDSLLLIEAMQRCVPISGSSVLDVCTGSGVVAIAAADLGASKVSAVDICPCAVQCARANPDDTKVRVEIRRGSWSDARGHRRRGNRSDQRPA